MYIGKSTVTVAELGDWGKILFLTYREEFGNRPVFKDFDETLPIIEEHAPLPTIHTFNTLRAAVIELAKGYNRVASGLPDALKLAVTVKLSDHPALAAQIVTELSVFPLVEKKGKKMPVALRPEVH